MSMKLKTLLRNLAAYNFEGYDEVYLELRLRSGAAVCVEIESSKANYVTGAAVIRADLTEHEFDLLQRRDKIARGGTMTEIVVLKEEPVSSKDDYKDDYAYGTDEAKD